MHTHTHTYTHMYTHTHTHTHTHILVTGNVEDLKRFAVLLQVVIEPVTRTQTTI